MTRTILLSLLGLFLLASFSAQAGGKKWHKNNHHRGHHNNHAGYHYNLHSGYRYGCRKGHHNHHHGQTHFYAVPNVPVGTRYGYSTHGSVIVFQPYTLNGHRY